MPRHQYSSFSSLFVLLLSSDILLGHEDIGTFVSYLNKDFLSVKSNKMSSKQINILLTGATGYIGGSILVNLLQHPNAKNFKITALIRGEESRTKKLASLGVIPLIGSNDSHDIIEKAASESHVVIHTANSADDLPSIRSIISGLNKRTQMTGKPAIYIHTSGTAVLAEDVRGKKGSNKVYSDLDPDQINSLPDERIHRNVDLLIINAAHVNPLLKSVIILPPVVHGTGTGPFGRDTMVPSLLIRTALKRGKVQMIGPGESAWNSVHIADLVDAYIILLDQLLAAYGPDAKHSPYLTTGNEGYYFAEDGLYSGQQVFEKIGEVLYKKGILKSPKVTSFTDDEVASNPFGPFSWFVASYSNSKAERLRKMGWKPYRPNLLDSFEEEVDHALNNDAKN
jgi:nucleoside-diphosphate-sugar epimerase